MADSLKRFLFSDDEYDNSIFTRPASTSRCLSEASNARTKSKISDVNERKRSSRSDSTKSKVTKLTSNKVQLKKNAKKRFLQRNSGRWKPTDDLLLITSVLQVNDLDIVWNAAKFSCKFTFEEVRLRWNALLYDELVNRTAISAINKLHPEQQEIVFRNVPFSLEEEDLICDIISTDNPSLNVFQNLLDRNSGTFFHSRTAKALEKHWRLLKKYELLCDQRPITKPCAAGEFPPSFENAEIDINMEAEQDPIPSYQGQIDYEIRIMDSQNKRKIRYLEEELGNWMLLLGSSRYGAPLMPEFDSRTFAILHGQRLRFAMRKRFIIFGRITETDDEVDVDLSIEGPVHKVSRRQGAIEMHANGSFWTYNFGKRPFFVDGKPVLPMTMLLIQNNSIFDIYGINFIFLLNKDLIQAMYFKGLEVK